MWKKTKYIMAAILVAYLIGAAPQIIDFIDDKIILSSSNVITLRPEFSQFLYECLESVRTYSKYFILIYAAVVAGLIFLENNNPDRTLLWLLVLIFVPFLGMFIYLLIGPDFDNVRRRHKYRPTDFVPVPKRYRQDMRIQTAQMLREVVGAELTRHNRVKVLINGDEAFPEMLEAIAAAKKFIHFQFFIIKDDKTGRIFHKALTDAAARGVKVRVLYDAIGSREITADYVKTLRKAGVQCLSFMPVAFPTFRRKLNFRNHRKICVVDGTVAFTGGLNISNSYIHKGHMGFWRDTHLRLEGECVQEIDKIFLADWQDRTDITPEQVIAEDEVTYEMNPESFEELPVQVVPSGVSSPWHSIEMGFISIISRAKKRVWLATPYFVPGPLIMTALRMAALSGVDVRVMVPEKGDSFLTYWGSRSNFEELLSAGVKIYMYRKGFIHAKTTLTDDDICSAGTCNLDVRSLEINFEDQVFMYDKATAKEFEKQYEKDMEECELLGIEEWQKRGFCKRLLESFGKLYSAQI